MTAVLERAELEASPLADLHAIADQIGLDGFRRLRKAELIDTILDRTQGADKPARTGRSRGTPAQGEAAAARGGGEAEEEDGTASTTRRRRPRRARGAGEEDEERGGTRRVRGTGEGEERGGTRRARGAGEEDERGGTRRGRGAGEEDERGGTRRRRAAGEAEGEARGGTRRGRGSDEGGGRHDAEAEEGTRSRASRGSRAGGPERVVEGVVELLGNGSAFLRVSPPEASDEDAYISAAQVRRCELVSGDRVSGPVRTPRSSERYPSLARVDSINGASADAVAEGVRYEDLPVAYPSQRLELDAEDPTLGAIEWLTPIGRGSRASIVGPARSGKSETLRRLLGALAGREGLQVMVVLSGVRPEEASAWAKEAPVTPTAALSFAASADLQGQTVEHVVETARRVAARGGDVVVLIDGLDGLHPHVARKILANARNLAEGGSLTLIATATRPLGGESTVIALDLALASTGHFPALDLAASGTVRPELLVGEDGAAAITRARANALKS